MLADHAYTYRSSPRVMRAYPSRRDGRQPQFSAMLTYLAGMFSRSVAWANPRAQVGEDWR
jgi:hypothetical protein